MGSKIQAYYQEAEKIGGLKAKMRLAILTKIPSTDAASAPDSPENTAKFEAAMQKLKQEFK